VEAVNELRVQTSTPASEFGRLPGGPAAPGNGAIRLGKDPNGVEPLLGFVFFVSGGRLLDEHLLSLFPV
jgi:hypothetical protein